MYLKINFKSIGFVFFLLVLAIGISYFVTSVDAKTIDITTNSTTNEINSFFNKGEVIGNQKLRNGDTVIFHKGDYDNLRLNIKKRITLKSKGSVYFGGYRGSKIIIGSNVKVKGFKSDSYSLTMVLKGNNNELSRSIINCEVLIKGSKNKLYKNSITNVIIQGGKNYLKGNKISSRSMDYGVYILGSKNRIYNNYIHDSNDGICLKKGFSNVIKGNVLSSNYWNGIYIIGSNNNKITKNKLKYNNCGIYYRYGYGNNIFKNHFYRNKIRTQSFY
ncbi:hypothetical protein MBCUT_06420 [Methanobrevibacter cuticularis]|uniref:Right handed beta helix domain-containing protein n=1 Tax=Methanobrevibacter cuticularis TaxID=47311 RepID=A0A166EL48_9EURY|nr:right-handed parallel beta-helix repeat-containing protein [Methanobrevibacter cuticularis]KZX16778.1 hypothetical protein MBCUT_06420 [Methanobrevibacter cuticularis]